ncbi:hypothetical protein CLAVI_000310 [Candidatus Clavichlamydia salmonicola]|uniref:hypothetical protein n=1 Tax=Candidatus Clavichlamydia salmonicola TaxID=469812 RepID=UPI001890D03B|nr:hypothetical protein [Candidatus Clavichlamydia salmonicola]MBF5050695.1 hypothetical protein [Candidatus Clavichlamydia salmonicola]
MAIFPFGDQVESVNTVNSKDTLYPVELWMQKWRCRLQDFFFGSKGLLVTQRDIFNQSIMVFPDLIFSYLSPYRSLLHEEVEVMITIAPYKGGIREGLPGYIEHLKASIFMITERVKQHNKREILIVRSRIGGKSVKAIRLSFPSFVQCMASLLYLYKDILSYNSCMIEGVKEQRLRLAVEALPAEFWGTGSCNALKEMILQAKELSTRCVIQQEKIKVIGEVDSSESNMGYFLQKMRRNIYARMQCILMPKDTGVTEDEIMERMQSVSATNFIFILREWTGMFPEINLVRVLEKQPISRWKIILAASSVNLLKIIPLNLLQKVLRDISKIDLLEIINNMSINFLVNILQEMPSELLEKILLEMPKGIVCKLQQKIGATISLIESLNKQIKDSIVQLKMLKKMNELSLPGKGPSVLSLRSLALSSIFKASNRSLVCQENMSLSLTYVERMALLYPGLQDEVYRKVRVGVKIPIKDLSPEFNFLESQSLDYLPELDLLPLASMVTGYEELFKKALLQKCGCK